jgi:hypothetical protein
MADNIINLINNIFPIDYLAHEDLIEIITILESIITESISKSGKSKKEQEILKRKVSSWDKLTKEEKYDEIILDDSENTELQNAILIFISRRLKKKTISIIDETTDYRLLSHKPYQYLYLIQAYLPIVSEKIDITSLVSKNKKKFIQHCHSLVVFDRNDTAQSIEHKFDKLFMEYFDIFIYCIEDFLDINLVCISPDKFGQKNSCIKKSFVSARKFLIQRETRFFYFDNDEWYTIDYLEMSTMKINTYNEIKNEYSDMRLKRLIAQENERELLDKLVVKYEPTDIGRKLPVIKVVIKGKTIRLLVGSTYNLYLYSKDDILNDTNVILGKIDVIDINKDEHIGKGNIRWIEGYQEILDI